MNTRPKLLILGSTPQSVFERLQKHFDIQVNEDVMASDSPELKKLISDKDALLLTWLRRIDKSFLEAAPKLKIIANTAVDYNNFDIPSMQAAGVVGTNTPGVLTDTTADLGFALLLAAARRVTEGERLIRSGQWKKSTSELLLGEDVHHRTLGIIGMGRIGKAIARRGVYGFGMNLIYHNRTRLPEAIESDLKARYIASKQELLREADHIVLALPYTPEAHHYIDKADFELMKPTAIFINIARGKLVNELALAQALRERRITAAGLDVFEKEPHVSPEILALDNVVLTPHIGSATEKTRLAMANTAADNLISFFTTGKALNPVTNVLA